MSSLGFCLSRCESRHTIARCVGFVEPAVPRARREAGGRREVKRKPRFVATAVLSSSVC